MHDGRDGSRGPRPRVALVALATVLLWGLVPRPARTDHDEPALGSPDGTFSFDGEVVRVFDGRDARATDVAVDSVGRLLVAGHVTTCDDDLDCLVSFVAVRYLPDGQIDTSFGGDGAVGYLASSGFDTGTPDFAGPLVAVQSDGKILLAGSIQGVFPGFLVARFLSDGTGDDAFGDTGLAGSPLASVGAAHALAVQPDGRILLAGMLTGATTGQDLCVFRYLANGDPDPDFGMGGRVAPTVNGDQVAHAVAVTAAGRILLAGSHRSPGGFEDFLLARLRSDGEPDELFGSFGYAVTSFGVGDDVARGLALQVDGKIVLAGSTFNGSNLGHDYAVARYAANGTLDGTFSDDGRATVILPNDQEAHDVVVQRTGTLVIGGVSRAPSQPPDRGLWAFRADGMPSVGFGTAGGVTGPPGDFAALALQADGKIVAAGHATPLFDVFLAARYHGLPDHIFDDSFGG
jgi:uncharacterized delta-60 repeat protein